jgi:Mn-dependent DtxR family transcriptional regulator
MLSSNMEDYMKTIYSLYQSGEGKDVHISDIAAKMGFRKASVSKATDLLAGKGLVQKDKYRCLYLTKQGLEYALFIERRYDLLTRFLNKVLGMELEAAQIDACGMEHVISGECYRLIGLYMEKTVFA